MKSKILQRITFTIMLFASISHSYSQRLGNVAMGGGGYVTGILMSKTEQNLMYCRTDVGGGYRWDSNENKWIPLNDWASTAETGLLGVESIAVDPINSDNFYMLLGTSYFNNGKTVIYRTTDRGNTFTLTDVSSQFKAHGNGNGRGTGEKLVVDPHIGSLLFCGTRDKGLFKSTNSGSSWSKVSTLSVSSTTNGNGISCVLFDPSSGSAGNATKTLFVGVSRTADNFFRSDDGGATFTPVASVPMSLIPQRATWACDTSLIVLFANGVGPSGSTVEPLDQGQVWKYKIKSGTWTNISPKSFTRAFGGVTIDPKNAKRIVVSSTNTYQHQASVWGDQIFITNDGGTNWKNIISSGYKFDANGVPWASDGLAIHVATSIEFDPFDTRRAFVNSGNGVFTTDNIDANPSVWKFFVKGLEETVPMDAISIPGGPLLSVVGDVNGFRSKDPDLFGSKLIPGVWGSFQSISYAGLKKNMVFTCGGTDQIYFSTDTALTFKKCPISKGKDGKLAISSDGKVVLHCPGNSTVTYRSTDNGSNWMPVNGLAMNNAEPVADLVNPSIFYVYDSSTGKLMISSNGGISFTSSGTLGGGGSNHIRTVPSFEGHIWAAMNGGGLIRSINYGASFTKLNNLTSCSAVGLGKNINGSTYPALYVWGTYAGVEGLYFSTDEGASWNRLNDDAHEWGGPANGQFVVGDFNVLGRAFMSTAGRGIVYASADFMLGASKLTIDIDENIQINNAILNGQTVNWTWTSSSDAIAKVSSTGLVTGKSYGIATITATSDVGQKVKIAIRVAKALQSLTIENGVDTLGINQMIQLSAVLNPTDATVVKVTWGSADPSVATVSATGQVKSLKRGNVIITAIADGKKASLLMVVGVPVKEIILNPTIYKLAVNDTIRLIPQVLPANASDKSITWMVDNPLIATVDPNGLVKGIKIGTAIITATTVDGQLISNSKITVSKFTGITETQKRTMSIFPNPLTGNSLTIDLGSISGINKLQIIGTLGNIIFQQQIKNNQSVTLNLNLSTGLYIVKASNDKNQFVSKLIVK